MPEPIDWTAPENQVLRHKCKLQAMRNYRTQEEWEAWILEDVFDSYNSVLAYDCFFCECSLDKNGWISCEFCFGVPIEEYMSYPCIRPNMPWSECFCRGWNWIKEAFKEEPEDA